MVISGPLKWRHLTFEGSLNLDHLNWIFRFLGSAEALPTLGPRRNYDVMLCDLWRTAAAAGHLVF